MSSKKWILILLLLSIANCLLYNPFNLYFLNDDFLHIPLTENGVLFQQRSIRPIHEILVKFDLWLWQKNAYGFHITALVLHFIVAIEVFFTAKILLKKVFLLQEESTKQISFFAAAVFLFYPQHAESLAWILGRTPTLATIFFLPTIILFFKEKKYLVDYFLAFLLYSLTLFTYEQSILFVFVFFFLWFIEKKSTLKKEKLFFSLLIFFNSVVYIIARKLITTEIAGNYEAGNLTQFNFISIANNAYKLLTRLFLNPLNSPKLYLFVSITFLVLLFIFITSQRKKLLQPTQLFFPICIAVLLIPILSLGISVRSYESGRYLYMPSVFLSIYIAYQFYYLKNHFLKLSLVLLFFSYWFFGKIQSAKHFTNASNYSKNTQQKIKNNFLANKESTITIDTLHITVNRLPVYRMGLKTGALWLNNDIDTNKIVVKYVYDEFIENP